MVGGGGALIKEVFRGVAKLIREGWLRSGALWRIFVNLSRLIKELGGEGGLG